MRHPFLLCALAALAIAAAAPIEATTDNGPAAPLIGHVVLPASDEIPAAMPLQVASTCRDDVEHSAFLSLKPSLPTDTSPEVLRLASGRRFMETFRESDLELSYFPRLPTPSWRIVQPNGDPGRGRTRELRGVVNVSRG